MKKYWLNLWCVLFVLLISHTLLQAKVHLKEGSLVRDAEIEQILKDLTIPLLKTAGVDAKKLKIYLVHDKTFNAAASFGPAIFINTGLLLRLKPEELVGVLAHETAHIALYHLSRFSAIFQKASLISLASLALGLGVGLASQSVEVGLGLASVGHHIAVQSIFQYSRDQESGADQKAIVILQKLNWPVKGLSSFMQYLKQQELWHSDLHNMYIRTHPLSSTRVSLLEKHVEKNAKKNSVLPSDLLDKHKWMLIKLKSFIEPTEATLLKNNQQKKEKGNIYARAIAYYQQNKNKRSLAEIAKLKQLMPNNAYLYEFEGRILFEMGQINLSYNAYKKALKFAPEDNLIRLDYLLVMTRKKNFNKEEAIKNIYIVLKSENKNPNAWHLLSIIYSALKQPDRAALALAEKYLTINNFVVAIKQAKRAIFLTKNPKIKNNAEEIVQFSLQQINRIKR